MATIHMGKVDEGFLLSEANGFRSREAVKLKAGSAYEPGSVLVEETAGTYALASTAALAAAAADAKLAILCRGTNAVAKAVEAAVILRDAEVKDTELVFGAGADLEDVADRLDAQGIVVRNAI